MPRKFIAVGVIVLVIVAVIVGGLQVMSASKGPDEDRRVRATPGLGIRLTKSPAGILFTIAMLRRWL